MKRRKFIKQSGMLLAAGALPLLSFSKSSGAPFAEVVIKLYVDTGSITKDNVAEVCTFEGQGEDTALENFTTHVNFGDNVTWEGYSSSSDADDVQIVAIRHDQGKNAFDRAELLGDRARRQKVRAKISTRHGEGEFMKYRIFFTVLNNGVKRGGMFQIDPVIQVHG